MAYSNKRQQASTHGRLTIGKFGIGKLATYVLANKLTYICKAADGVIRTVTMNYRDIGPDQKAVLIKDLSLELRETGMQELEALLSASPESRQILELIHEDMPVPPRKLEWEDEFGGVKSEIPKASGCWTLVVLSDLKDQGKAVKKGIVRRMIQTSLPLGAELNIVLNGELLSSSKADRELMKEWAIGPDLGLTSITLPPEEGVEDEEELEQVPVTASSTPYPHVELPGLGQITGRVRLFVDKITGGKSDELGSSNGFYVNVLGRVTNQDPAFGEKDLSHSAWARFRMTVRADGLDKHLAVNREQFSQSRELRLFRAFLRRAFNMARSEYDQFVNSSWSDSGAAIINKYGTLPLIPLREVIGQSITGSPPVSDLVDMDGINNQLEAFEQWEDDTRQDAREVIRKIEFEEKDPEGIIAQYRIADRSLIVNSSHPFVQEHSSTHAEKIAVRNFALIQFLSDVHALEIGIDPVKVEELRKHRDGMARLIAKINRKSGLQIAKILLEVSTHKDYRAFEIIVQDALEYLGFFVDRMALPGQPEGIAKAYPTPSFANVKELYSFSFDAKSSKHGKVKTGNVNVAGLARHRRDHTADHALVVAPDFEEGALEKECAENGVTPMRAEDMGTLLLYTAEFGAIPLTKLREVFKFTSPDAVAEWVKRLRIWLQQQRRLTFDVFIGALRQVEQDIPDALAAAVLARECRKLVNSEVTKFDILALARGLQIMVPDLVRVDKEDIVISAHPNKLVDAVASQLNIVKDVAEDRT